MNAVNLVCLSAKHFSLNMKMFTGEYITCEKQRSELIKLLNTL